jgi:Arc/MetJ-type ribon-helix-helix transcriptional regulator
MQVDLTPETQRLVENELKSGNFRNASDVVNSALQTLSQIRNDYEAVVRRAPKTLAELEHTMLESLDRLERGEGVPAEEAYDAFREHLNKRARR